MDGHKLIGLTDGSGAGDSVRYEQVVGVYLPLAGGTMAGDIAMGRHKLTGLAAGEGSGDSLCYDQVVGVFLPSAGGTMTGDLNLTDEVYLTWGGTQSNSIRCQANTEMQFLLDANDYLTIRSTEVQIRGTRLLMEEENIETRTDSTGQIGTTTAAFLSAHVDTYYLGQSTTEYIAGGTAAVLVTAGGTEKLSVGAVITDKVGAAVPIVAKTADYLVTTSDHTILVDATSDDVDITLPDAADVTGRVVVIKRTDDSANVVRVVAQAGEDIDANQHYFLSDRWDSITVQSYGDNWYVIAQVEGSLEPSSSSSA
jgi:hypothetical protein